MKLSEFQIFLHRMKEPKWINTTTHINGLFNSEVYDVASDIFKEEISGKELWTTKEKRLISFTQSLLFAHVDSMPVAVRNVSRRFDWSRGTKFVCGPSHYFWIICSWYNFGWWQTGWSKCLFAASRPYCVCIDKCICLKAKKIKLFLLLIFQVFHVCSKAFRSR